MSAVLGIDAAWTPTQPSGVALVRRARHGWTCVALAPSYAAFFALAEGRAIDWDARAAGEAPDPVRLLESGGRLVGPDRIRCVAVDLPLASTEITGRRAADDAVVREFGGARRCGTHSPTPTRPGRLATTLRDGFAAAGFRLATATTAPGTPDALLEVYPHPAIMRLCGLGERARYKLARRRRYWPGDTPERQTARILGEWRRISGALTTRFAGICLPAAARLSSLGALKGYEDALDALVCAWVGVRYLAGRAHACGDDTAAIWIPC
jgi:predicted RNase H-like nuclease